MALGNSIARFEIDANDLANLRLVLNPKQMDRAIYNAVKRTVAKGRNIAAKKIQSRLNVLRKYIDAPNNRSAAIKTFMRTGVSAGSIYINQVRMPLGGFKPRQTKHGATVVIDKARPAQTFRHGFIATVASQNQLDQGASHRGVFERSDRAAPKRERPGRKAFERAKALTPADNGTLTKEGYAGRLHIDELFGPSILDFFSRAEISGEILRDIGNELPKQLDSQISRFLNGKAKSLSEAIAQLDSAPDPSTDAN